MTDHSDPSRADAILRRLRSEKGIIAMVGASAKPERASYQVMTFMQKAGIRVIPVNPGMTGETLLGETVVARLADITLPVWMVDVFRPAEACPPIAEEAIAIVGHLPVAAGRGDQRRCRRDGKRRRHRGGDGSVPEETDRGCQH